MSSYPLTAEQDIGAAVIRHIEYISEKHWLVVCTSDQRITFYDAQGIGQGIYQRCGAPPRLVLSSLLIHTNAAPKTRPAISETKSGAGLTTLLGTHTHINTHTHTHREHACAPLSASKPSARDLHTPSGLYCFLNPHFHLLPTQAQSDPLQQAATEGTLVYIGSDPLHL